MTEHVKKRCLDAINRAMLYCLKVANGERCVVVLGQDQIVSTDELYDTILHLRTMLPSKDEARNLRQLVMGERAVCAASSHAHGMSAEHRIEYARRASKLDPLVDKLEVLCGQA